MVEKAIYSGVGRRKEAVARVWMRPGSGKMFINGRTIDGYFGREILKMKVTQPLELVNLVGKYDIKANVHGGGESGQADAIRLGIARSLLKINESFKSTLRHAGMLTRDPRMKERKKYGQEGARRKFQFSKR